MPFVFCYRNIGIAVMNITTYRITFPAYFKRAVVGCVKNSPLSRNRRNVNITVIAPVNTLPDVTMIMIKYKNYEGDIEIINGSDGELQTGEWFCIQKWEEGSWHRVDELIDGIWKEVAYRLPAGETAVLQTSWKTLFGELPPGKYRIIKKVYVEAADRTDIHYLAAEFEINKNN